MNCRDNTVGWSCDQCRYGYYVNSSASLNDTNICIGKCNVLAAAINYPFINLLSWAHCMAILKLSLREGYFSKSCSVFNYLHLDRFTNSLEAS